MVHFRRSSANMHPTDGTLVIQGYLAHKKEPPFLGEARNPCQEFRVSGLGRNVLLDVDFDLSSECITQLKDQGPSRTCNDNKEEKVHDRDRGVEGYPRMDLHTEESNFEAMLQSVMMMYSGLKRPQILPDLNKFLWI